MPINPSTSSPALPPTHDVMQRGSYGQIPQPLPPPYSSVFPSPCIPLVNSFDRQTPPFQPLPSFSDSSFSPSPSRSTLDYFDGQTPPFQPLPPFSDSSPPSYSFTTGSLRWQTPPFQPLIPVSHSSPPPPYQAIAPQLQLPKHTPIDALRSDFTQAIHNLNQPEEPSAKPNAFTYNDIIETGCKYAEVAIHNNSQPQIDVVFDIIDQAYKTAIEKGLANSRTYNGMIRTARIFKKFTLGLDTYDKAYKDKLADTYTFVAVLHMMRSWKEDLTRHNQSPEEVLRKANGIYASALLKRNGDPRRKTEIQIERDCIVDQTYAALVKQY